MNRKKTNILATQAVDVCRDAIAKAVAAMPEGSGNASMMESMILDTLTAELLANGRTNRWAHIPETGVVGGFVEILVNHGELATSEPVIQHALSVLYLLGEEQWCKEAHDQLRVITNAYLNIDPWVAYPPIRKQAASKDQRDA